MARKPRVYYPGALYHTILRGNGSQTIFFDDRDRTRFCFLLQEGVERLMLAGGSDSLSRITYTGFARLGAIAAERCQPFDLNRKAIVPGEGAAVLVLEPAELAERRGARIYAELVGYGLSCDAHHMTASHPEGAGAARAMNGALKDAGLRPEDVDYVSAHGTGTPTNDRLETLSIKKVFGEVAHRVPISSAKLMLGHTMGAASAIEAAICSLAIARGWIYVAVNCAMMWRAAARVGGSGVPAAAAWLDLAGAVAFGASDTLIALDRFAAPLPGVRWPIMLLYWLGQWGIAASAVCSRPR